MMSSLSSVAALLFSVLFTVVPKPALVASPVPAIATSLIKAEKKKKDGAYIPWVPDYRLTWNDFLCAPQRNTDAVASTSTALGIA
jgi:hypothetical protein